MISKFLCASCLLLMFFVSKGIGQTTFAGQKVITSWNMSAFALQNYSVVDIDGDGYLDILASSWIDEKLAWYRNFGNGNFSVQRVIATNGIEVSNTTVADLDLDGNNDIVYIYDNHKIGWYRNKGNQQFSDTSSIATNLYYINKFKITDIDGDGDQDILAYSTVWESIVILKNDGDGVFNEVTSFGELGSGSNDPKYNTHFDIDGDGDFDILLAFGDFPAQIGWLENDGTGNFGEMIVLDSISGVLGIADLDGDNLKDFFTWSFEGKNWYKNEGNGNFSSKIPLEDLTLYQHVKVLDFDLDNDIDILTYSSSTSKLYKNDGAGNFVEDENFEFPKVFNFSMHDLNNDNDLDIVFANSALDQVGFFENNGEDKFTVKKIITSSTYNILAVHALDVNGDGLMDVITSAENQLSWFENLGLNYYSQQQFISESISLARSISSNDFDNDGIIDLVCNNYGGNLYWYKNDGQGNFTRRLVVESQFSTALYAADLDNDGDIDIVASFIDKLRWYENDGDGNFINHDIELSRYVGIESITTADLNNDGFLDIIVSTGSSLHGVMWLENNGNGGFDEEHIFGELFDNSLAVTTGDYDGDNDIDIVAIHGRKIIYYKNSNDGNFTSFRILYDAQGGFFSLGSIYSTDLDNDGDLDIATATYSDNTVAWFQNNNGAFSTQKIISDNFRKAISVYAEDLDNDGDKDIIAASFDEHKSAWFENKLPNCNIPIRKKIIDSFAEGTSYQLTPDSSTTLAGQYVFTFQSYYGCDSIVTFYLTTYIVSSLNNQENAFGLQIAPNPFKNYTIIQFKHTPNFSYDLKLYDLQGKYIKGFYGLAERSFRLNKEELPSGLYFLNFYRNGEDQILQSYKLIVN